MAKRPAHRPTDYKGAETIKKVREYLNLCKDEYVGLGKIRVKLPSIEGLSVYLDVSRSTLYLWRENHQEFSDILEELLSRQAEVLLNNGLSGDYNSTIAKLVLGKHGYTDKTELTGKDGKDLISPEAKEKGDQAIKFYLNGNPSNNSTWNPAGN
jgi:hypothetical protein